MAFVLVKHRVNDFQEWKKAFDSALEKRRAGGEVSHKILNACADPQLVVCLFEWDRLDHAKSFFDHPDLADAMTRAGVAEEPSIDYLGFAFEG